MTRKKIAFMTEVSTMTCSPIPGQRSYGLDMIHFKVREANDIDFQQKQSW